MGHEDLHRQSPVRRSSDRAFGAVFAGLFALVALLPLPQGRPVRVWSLGVAAAFALAALAAPRLLAPLNRLWAALGAGLHAIVSPAVLGVVYYLVIVPSGTALRMLGKDPLRLRFDRAASSYWIDRRPPGPPPESFRDPF